MKIEGAVTAMISEYPFNKIVNKLIRLPAPPLEGGVEDNQTTFFFALSIMLMEIRICSQNLNCTSRLPLHVGPNTLCLNTRSLFVTCSYDLMRSNRSRTVHMWHGLATFYNFRFGNKMGEGEGEAVSIWRDEKKRRKKSGNIPFPCHVFCRALRVHGWNKATLLL